MYLNKTVNEIALKDLIIMILIISILFHASCTGKGIRDYKYIETSMQTNLATTAPKEQRLLEIRAISDSAAYVKAYQHFCISKTFYNREYKKSGAIAGKPLSFKLLNEESIDISKSINFLNKESIEMNIEKKVWELENAMNSER